MRICRHLNITQTGLVEICLGGSPKSVEIMQLEMVSTCGFTKDHINCDASTELRPTRIVQCQLISPGGVCAYGCKLISIASQGGLTANIMMLASTIYHSFIVTCFVYS